MAKHDAMDETFEQVTTEFGKGLKAVFTSPIKLCGLIAIIVVCRYCTVHREAIAASHSFSANAVLLVWLLPLFLILGYSASAPKSWDEKFDDIRFTNKKGNFPQLVSKKKVQTPKGPIQELVFRSPGIPIERWKSSVSELQSTFDATIINIMKYEGSMQNIQLKLVTDRVIPNMVEWNDSFIREKDFELVAGEGLIEDVVFNLNKYPHALIAGMTGSGKSVILRCLLWQCIKKGAKLYVVDFKGGVEFSNWQDMGLADVVTEEESAGLVFNHLQQEMRLRLNLFSQEKVKNIAEYNKRHPEAPLCRIVLGCDEVAEMLDMEGLSKEDKKEKEALSQAMASLARLSRAAGIHMLLGMQRPDAKVLKGQIKNNTPIRVSGAFPDAVASQIVLGNDEAGKLDNIAGRMLYNLGAQTYEFQAYWFDDDKVLRPGNYLIGSTLNQEPLGVSVDPIKDSEFKDFEVPKAEMDEWDWSDMSI